MKQLEARKLNQFLVATENKSWRDDNSLLVELTGIGYVGGVNRDTNGDSLTVELQTRMFQTQRVLVIASDRGSNVIQLFFNSNVNERGEKYRATVVVYKDPKGRRKSIRVARCHFGTIEDVQDRCKHAFQLEPDGALLKDLASDLYYSSAIKTNVREALQVGGYKIEEVMQFTHEFMMTPKFIRQSKTAVEIGWMSFGTYASHPCTIKISKRATDPKMVPLYTLGAESSGYYDHHNKHYCKPEHAAAFKRFAKQFKSKLNK